MVRRIFIIISILIIGISKLEAQDPSPKKAHEREDLLASFALKVSNNPNLYTGNVGLTIPLYTYTDNDFEFPVSLSYNSSGYRVNDFIGYTGLGWNLNAGGYITRTVKGVADEQSIVGGRAGFYHLHKNTKDRNYFSLFMYGNFIPITAWADPHEYYWTDPQVPIGKYETTPDRFDFKFMSFTGTFYLGIDTVYVVESNVPQGEFRIKVERDYEYGQHSRFNEIKFKITAGDGYEYTFRSLNQYYNKVGLHKVSALFEPFTSSVAVSEWYLTEIKARNGRVVNINYNKTEGYGYLQTYALSNREWDENGYRGDGRPLPEVLKNHEGLSLHEGGFGDPMHIPGFRLGESNRLQFFSPIKNIIFDNGVSIGFSYEEREEDRPNSTTLNYDLGYAFKAPVIKRLSGIVIEDTHSKLKKTYDFNYKYSSLSGHWTSRRPVFFLKEILTSEGELYEMDYYNEDRAYPMTGSSIDHWGFYNNGGKAYPIPHTFVDANNIETYGNEPERGHAPDFNGAILGILKTITYPTGGYTKFYYEPHACYYKVTKDLTNNNKPYLRYEEDNNIGGVRIKKITDYSSLQDSTYREYKYMEFDEEDNQFHSSGILLHTPRYSRHTNLILTKDESMGYTMHGDYTHTKDRNHIGYSQVYEYFPDNSYTLYKFSDYRLLPDIPFDETMTKQGEFPSRVGSAESVLRNNFHSKYDSHHLDRGNLIGLYHYSPRKELIYSKENIYDYSKYLQYFKYVERAYSFYYLQKFFTQAYPLKESIETSYSSDNSQKKIINKERYTYNDLGQIVNKQITASDGVVISEQRQFIYDIPQSKRNNNQHEMYNRNIIKYPIRTQIKRSDSGILSGSHFNYRKERSSSFDVMEISSLKREIPLVAQDFNFDQYLSLEKSYIRDGQGNIIQMKDRGFQYTVYLWNSRGYLIGEIKNCSLNQLKLIPGFEQIETKLTIEKLEKAHIDRLYNIENAFVTLYEYSPLVGLISETNPARTTTYYEYNSSGKLKRQYIKDENNKEKTIKVFDYNLKNIYK